MLKIIEAIGELPDGKEVVIDVRTCPEEDVMDCVEELKDLGADYALIHTLH